jgi:hypothetical protein
MTDRSALPIPDYDHLPLAGLVHRIRTLTTEDLQTLLEHERAHGDRLPVVQAITARLDSLRNGEATPSGGDPGAPQPEQAPPPAGGSSSTGTGVVDTEQPLRHGVAGQTPNRQIRAR